MDSFFLILIDHIRTIQWINEKDEINSVTNHLFRRKHYTNQEKKTLYSCKYISYICKWCRLQKLQIFHWLWHKCIGVIHKPCGGRGSTLGWALFNEIKDTQNASLWGHLPCYCTAPFQIFLIYLKNWDTASQSKLGLSAT